MSKTQKKLLVLLLVGASIVSFSFRATEAQTSSYDLINLAEFFGNAAPPNLIKAYEEVSVLSMWDLANRVDPTLSSVGVGIVEASGVDGGHREFDGVEFASSTPSDLIDDGIEVRGVLRSHGTNVAGIIGASNLSSLGATNYVFPHMNGVMSGVRGLSFTLEVRKSKTLFGARTKISELVAKDIPLVNLSGGTNFAFLGNLILHAPIEKATSTLFVVAAGNSDEDAEGVSPASLGDNFSNVITVAASTINDNRESTSNFGNAVAVASPGDLVLSPTFFQEPLDFTNDYEFFSGTSASAPMVTGVAAILKALEPEYQKYTSGLAMSPAEIKSVLTKSADPIQTGEPGKRLGTGCYADPNDQVNTGCRLNAHRAVAWYLPPAGVADLSATAESTSSIRLAWQKPDDFDLKNPDLASYRIFRGIAPGVSTEGAPLTEITGADALSFVDSGLTPSTRYFYKVVVADKAGLRSSASNEANAVTQTPSQPVVLNPASDVTQTAATLSWSQNTDDDFESYGLYRSTRPGVDFGSELVATLTDPTETFFTDTGLSPNTTYFYKVFVFDKAGLSSGSNEVAVLTGPSIAESNWPFFHQNPQRTGKSSLAGINFPIIKWAYNVGSGIASSEIVVDPQKNLYFTAFDGLLRRISSTGRVEWTRNLSLGDTFLFPFGTPAIDSDGTIYLESGGDVLYALNLDGTTKWLFSDNAIFGRSDPLVVGGKIYFISFRPASLYVLDRNGVLVSKTPLGFQGRGSFAVAPDGTSLYVPLDRNILRSLSMNGETKWTKTLSDTIAEGPAVDSDGNIYMLSFDNRLTSLNSDGNVRWSILLSTVPQSVYSSLSINGSNIIYVGTHPSNTAGGQVIAVAPSGSIQWTTSLDGPVDCIGAVDAQNNLYVGTNLDGSIYKISQDGAILWKLTPPTMPGPPDITSCPILADNGLIYAASLGGGVFAIQETP